MKKTILSFVKSFYPPSILFLAHLFLISRINIYALWPDFDIPMHFLGGFMIGITGSSLFYLAKQEKWLEIRSFVLSLFLNVCFVVLIAFLWECAEWLGDHYFGTFMQAGLNDTMFDMFLGMCGGFLSSVIFLYKNFHSRKTSV